jgi:hypothetical protein
LFLRLDAKETNGLQESKNEKLNEGSGKLKALKVELAIPDA